MEKIKVAGLDTLYTNNNAKEAIVFLHGYGASMQDLAPLQEVIKTKNPVDWYFLDGVESVDFGPHMPPGKAWFPIDMEALQNAQNVDRINAYFDNRPKGFIEATDAVKKVLEELRHKYSHISIGGFSQGSMIAGDVAFEFNDWIKSLIVLSGTFVDKDHWDKQILKNKDIRIFQSHGLADPVLPFLAADKLSNFFKENINTHEFHPFQGGHEIPMEVIDKLNNFLSESNSD